MTRAKELAKLNYYVCVSCRKITATVDIDEGVTPMIIDCKAGTCNGDAHSTFYRTEGYPKTAPTWEWYRPSWLGRLFLDTANKWHVDQGGLLIRRRK